MKSLCLHPINRLAASLLFPLLLSLAGTTAATAGPRVWTGTGPRARSIEDIARDPLNPARLWAASFGAGVYRSLDSGATWTAYRNGLGNTYVRSLAVNPHHPDSVFCGTNDGVYLSLDAGVNWTSVRTTNSSVRSVAIHPIRTAVIYATTYGGGVMKSVNGGQNWSTINSGLVNTNVRDIAIHPAKPETLLVATGTGGGIHRSFNGGITWLQVPDTTATLGAAEQVEFDRLDPNRVYAAELDRGVLKSADGGTSWVRINRGLPLLRTRAIAIIDTLRYVGTDGQGVFFTTLNDTLWHPANAGIKNPVVDALLGTAIGAPVLAATDGDGIFRTAAADSHWVQLDGGLLATNGFALAVRTSDHRVFDGTGFGDQFWWSGDRGASWTRAGFIFSHDSERDIAIDPVTPNRVYMTAYGSGVYRSDTNGATWLNPDSLSLTLTNRSVRPLLADPGVAGHLFVGTGIGPFESFDAGNTWSPANQGLPASFSTRALALAGGAPLRLFAGSDSSGVWRSDDGGANWVSKNAGLPNPFIHSILVDATNPLTLYVATDSSVFKSTNGGDSWLPARTLLPFGLEARSLAQDLTHPAALFCGTWGGGVFESLNQGASWLPVFGQYGLGSLFVHALAVDGAITTLYAGTGSGVSQVSGYNLAPTSVAPAIAPEAGLALAVSPNPVAGGSAKVDFTLSRPGRASLAVYDLFGARVRQLMDSNAIGAGEHHAAWDGTSTSGARMGPGLYFIRLDTALGSRSTRLVRVTP